MHRIFTPIVFLIALAVLTSGTTQAQDKSSPREADLIAVLQSGAPPAEKAITCKLLAVHGSSAAVPELAKLLPNEQLSSWARIALEAIPGPEADAALRQAAESLQGRLLIGMLNSIGVRKDAQAVELLTARLKDQDAEAASAAAVALGHIGNDEAAKSLRAALAGSPEKVRSAVAEGCVLCAERRLKSGDMTAAAEIYDQVRQAELPQQRIIEATRGAILARGDEGIPLLLEQLRSSDRAMFYLGLGTAREFPGGKVDQALASELAQAQPDRAGLILLAMADRPDTVVLPAIVKAAAEGAPQVRLAAARALAKVGDATCLATLLDAALDENAELAATAEATLADLPDQSVDAEIVALLPKAEGAKQLVLINLVGKRRIAATPLLLKALDQNDAAVRSAALLALGETVEPDELKILIAQVVKPKNTADAAFARKALKAASVRMPDGEAAAGQLATALNGTDSLDTKTALLEILGTMQGPKALATIRDSTKSQQPELQDIGTRLLGEWMTADAAPVLLELSQTGIEGKYQVRALRGYIRIARQFVLPDDQRSEMCQKAFAASKQPAEKKLVLEVLQRYPNEENLQLAVKAMQEPELKETAAQATLAIAQKLGPKKANVSELLAQAGFEPVKLEIIKAEYGSGNRQKDVTAVVQNQARNLPLITLPKSTYNTSFGDPAPGNVKQLKIQYRINGKQGEATFAEDAPILLPQPK